MYSKVILLFIILVGKTELTLLYTEYTELRTVNNRLSRYYRMKKYRLQDRRLLIVGDIQNLKSIRSSVSQLEVVLPGKYKSYKV